ncbi:MAG: ACT domain-containing protein [Anaerorhabdus sp.]|jgi:chorismate mutase|uniref:ACT domain-containing protein n=1 Tax=Anaerorhabdus sp. TaxID=1872524 RepID=UPI002FCA9AE5
MEKYLIVSSKVLPDYFEKVLDIRMMVEANPSLGIREACKKIGISRSTYYKYKDHIFNLSNNMFGRKAELHLLLNHQPGVLSEVLKMISIHSCSVLSINQSIPLNDVASCSLLVDISNITTQIDQLVSELSSINGVKKSKLISLE